MATWNLRPPDRPIAWRFWFDIAATLLVVGGVFGEAAASGEIASINSQLRSKTSEFRAKSDQLLAVITEEAGDAAKSAKAAGLSAEQAKRDGKILARKLEDQTQRELAAEKIIEGERTKRLELAASLQPREICNQYDVTVAVSRFPAREILFEWVSDKEPRRLAEQIAMVFANTPGPGPAWPMFRRQTAGKYPIEEDGIPDGVRIWGQDNIGRELAFVLSNKLRSCGIEAEDKIDPIGEAENSPLPPNVLLIRVGSKPNRAVEAAIKELGAPSKFTIFERGDLWKIPNEPTSSDTNNRH